jgi:hypothetical protein
MKIGNVFTRNNDGTTTYVAVVNRIPDENGYFTAWALHVSHKGDLLSFTEGTYNLDDKRIKLVPTDAEAQPISSEEKP